MGTTTTTKTTCDKCSKEIAPGSSIFRRSIVGNAKKMTLTFPVRAVADTASCLAAILTQDAIDVVKV